MIPLEGDIKKIPNFCQKFKTYFYLKSNNDFEQARKRGASSNISWSCGGIKRRPLKQKQQAESPARIWEDLWTETSIGESSIKTNRL